MLLDIIFIITFVYSAYLDWRSREIFMPIVWILTPITILWAFLTSIQAFVGVLIAFSATLLLFLHYKVGWGDKLLYIVYAWYTTYVIGNTYQLFMSVPLLIGILLVLFHKVYPVRQTTMLKKKTDLVQGDIILEKYKSDPTRVLVYHGKPFITLLLLACGVVYLGFSLVFF